MRSSSFGLPSLLLLLAALHSLDALSVPHSLSRSTLRLKGGGGSGATLMADARRFGKGSEEFPPDRAADERMARAKAEEEKAKAAAEKAKADAEKAKAEEDKKSQAAKAAKASAATKSAASAGSSIGDTLGGAWSTVAAGAASGCSAVAAGAVTGYSAVKAGAASGCSAVAAGAATGYSAVKAGAATGCSAVAAGAVAGYNVVGDTTQATWSSIQKVSADGAVQLQAGAGKVVDIAKEGKKKAEELAKEGATKAGELYKEHPQEVQSAGAALLLLLLVRTVMGAPVPASDKGASASGSGSGFKSSGGKLAGAKANAKGGSSKKGGSAASAGPSFGTTVSGYLANTSAFTKDTLSATGDWVSKESAMVAGAVKNTTASASSGISKGAMAAADNIKKGAGVVRSAAASAGSQVGDFTMGATSLVVNTTSDATKAVWDTLMSCVGYTSSTVGLLPVNATVVSGSIESGNFVLELKKSTRVGGAIAVNKEAKEEGSGDKIRKIKCGSKDFVLELSDDRKTWTKVHGGWLRPPTWWYPYQYCAFPARSAKYIRFSTTSSYRGGAGLRDLKIIKSVGAPLWFWLWNPTDVIHSCFDARMSHMWGSTTVPEIKKRSDTGFSKSDIADYLKRTPIAVGRYLHFDTPDDLGLRGLNEKTKQTFSKMGAGVKNHTKVVAEVAVKASGATKTIAVSVGRTTGKVAGNVTEAATKLTKDAGKLTLKLSHKTKSAMRNATAATGRVWRNATAATKKAWQKLKPPQVLQMERVRRWWKRVRGSSSKAEEVKRCEGGGPGCMPVTALLLAAGGYAAHEVYPEETKKLIEDLNQAAKPLVEGAREKANKAWDKAQELAGQKAAGAAKK